MRSGRLSEENSLKAILKMMKESSRLQNVEELENSGKIIFVLGTTK